MLGHLVFSMSFSILLGCGCFIPRASRNHLMIPDAYDKNIPKKRRVEPGGYHTRVLLVAGVDGGMVRKKGKMGQRCCYSLAGKGIAGASQLIVSLPCVCMKYFLSGGTTFRTASEIGPTEVEFSWEPAIASM